MEDLLISQVNIVTGGTKLPANLIIPPLANKIVIFSHGSGSSRMSKRNIQVANYLQEKNFGTLLFDLLTEKEDANYYNRFDIHLLTQRLAGATEWLKNFLHGRNFSFGYFGASTGAASAVKAAAKLGYIRAIVSRGGRPDLAITDLSKINAPTLLLVGSRDMEVLQLNQQAFAQLKCVKQLNIINGATHLFEEPGAIEKVCGLAANWFEKYL